MDNRQTHRLAELVAAADIAIASAAAEPTESAAQGPQPAFETSCRVVERERFLPRDDTEMASTVRSTLLEARSCQVLAEIEFIRGRPPRPTPVPAGRLRSTRPRRRPRSSGMPCVNIPAGTHYPSNPALAS